jgi:NAD(P)-dependent dehydrogenase (short-subunit alcohol dehydrogenase family)
VEDQVVTVPSLTEAVAGLQPEVVSRLALDRRILVTGGGGDGLDFATCHRLAEQGASLAVLDVRAEAAEATAAAVHDRWGVDAMAVPADVGDRAQVRDAVVTVADRFGGIDILVNNTGDGLDSGPYFDELRDEHIDAVISLNFLGVLNETHAVLSVVLLAGVGRIINVAPEGGKFGQARNVVYNSCKAAVIAFTANLAKEIGPRGVSIAAVCLGIMVAERNLVASSRGASTQRLQVIEGAFARTSIGRCSLPDEVASVIAFLASEAGSYVHATAVSVGGGLPD